MKNMKISMKLLVSFMIVILLTIAIGGVGVIGMQSINISAQNLYKYNLVAVEAMGHLRELFGVERNDIRNIFLSQGDDEKVNSLVASFTSYKKRADEYFALYESAIVPGQEPEESAYFTAKDTYLGPYATMKNNIFTLVAEGKFEDAYTVFMAGSASITPIMDGFAESVVKNNTWAIESNNASAALFNTLTLILASALAASVIFSIILALYVSGIISKPLILMSTYLEKIVTTGNMELSQSDKDIIESVSGNRDELGRIVKSMANHVMRLMETNDILGKIANGDLSVNMNVLSDMDSLGLSIVKTIDNLNNMFGEINVSTTQVSSGSKQIADGAQALAQGSTEQASAVEELSSSISDIANKTKENAEKAMRAAALAETIKENAEKGSMQMDHMMSAVREIGEASQSINTVIKVIDNIAFQTNILALNASVEAARAGQHGKGFAVVADEVRSLAAKSAEAAKDTGALIANSMEKAELGARIAEETAASLADIVSGINESNQVVSEIARATEEQEIAITQINQGIEQVAQVVQQNSATAQESAAASEEMSAQSAMLEDLVAQFKLKSGTVRRNLPSKKHLKQIDAPAYNEPDPGGFGKY